MTITAAAALSEELRLLSIAGVRDVRGNRRLSALLPTLEKSGRRTAVFARLAERTRALLEAPKGRAASELLTLNALVGAVLRAQGAATPAGELGRFPEGGATSRAIPASALRALEDADWRTSRSVVDEASRRRWLEDPRLARIGLDRLRGPGHRSDGSLFLRTVARHGESVVPMLVSALEDAARVGGVGTAWAATLIDGWREADPASAERLARQLLDAESPWVFPLLQHGKTLSTSVRLAALRCLGDDATARAMLTAHLEVDDRRTRELARVRLLGLDDDGVRDLATLSGRRAEAVAMMDDMTLLPEGSWSDVVLELGHALAGKLDEPPETKGERAAGGLSRADARTLASLVRLLMRSEVSVERLKLLKRVCEDVEPSTKRASEFDGGQALELFEFLVANWTRFEYHDSLGLGDLVPAAMKLDAGRALRALLGHEGLSGLCSVLHDVDGATLARGLESVFGVDVSRSGASRRTGLPPPEKWGVGWFYQALSHDLVGLAEHLAVLGSNLEGWRVRNMPKARATALAHVVLSANPGCARQLKSRIVRRGRKGDTLVSLCRAIERRDPDRCRTLSEELSEAIGAESAEALGERLASWAGQKRRAA